ncbi:MAG: hypothetical protein ACK4N5_01820 [Myxococcales bacterium]
MVVLTEPVPAELARLLSAAGLEIRLSGDPSAPDVLLVDPRSVNGADSGLEQVIAARVCELLARVGDGVPALHAAVIDQTERGLFRAVLGHTSNHLGRASKILGLDRNTCARKARAYGFVDEPSRGRKPRSKPESAGRKSARPAKRGASKRPAGKRSR